MAKAQEQAKQAKVEAKDEKPEAKEPAARKKIWVRAVGRVGYYGDQRRFPVGHPHPRAGEPFQVYEDQFSDSKVRKAHGQIGWMERVEGPVTQAQPPAKTWAEHITGSPAPAGSQLQDPPKKDQDLRTNPPQDVI